MRLKLVWMGIFCFAALLLLAKSSDDLQKNAFATVSEKSSILEQAVPAPSLSTHAIPAIEPENERERDPNDPLDQGGETIALATVIPVLPYNDFGQTAANIHNYDVPCPLPAGARDVVYSYAPVVPQQITISLCGSAYDTKLFVFQNNSTTPVGCNDDHCGLQSQIMALPVAPPNIYYIVVDGHTAASFGTYLITVTQDQPPCDVTTQPQDKIECPEAPVPSHVSMDCDGGCNNDDWGGTNQFGTICAGETVSGICFTYTAPDNSSARDTDWFLFRMPVNGIASMIVQHEFDATYGIVNLDNCNNPSFIQFRQSLPNCAPLPLDVLLDPGLYAMFIAPSAASGVPIPSQYRATLHYPPVPICGDCPFTEQEPNDVQMEPLQPIFPGQLLCGAISCLADTDHYRLELPQAGKLNIHLYGNVAEGFCPGGQGLHPCLALLSATGDNIGFCGDTTNQATEFTSSFVVGPGSLPFVDVKVVGANYSTGPYTIEIELVALSLVAPPQPVVTITPNQAMDGVDLHWFAGYWAGEQILIEKAINADGPYVLLATVPANSPSFFDSGSEPFAVYRLSAIGERPQDPFVGHKIGLGSNGNSSQDWEDEGDFIVQEIEWAVNQENEVVMARLYATGVGLAANDILDQDNRAHYGTLLTPIQSFSGHYMNIFDRRVLIEHIVHAADPQNDEMGILTGRGTNSSTDTALHFTELWQFFEPNNFGVAVPWNGWFDGFWLDPCPGFCCRLKTIAFCTISFPHDASCFSPGGAVPSICPCNPLCWLGCPCPPPPTPLCCPPTPPIPPDDPGSPGCETCTLRPNMGGGFRFIYCMCPSDPTVPPSFPPFCMFVTWAKCKSYQCPQFPIPCDCALDPCPGPAVWTPVPPGALPGLKAACLTFCEP